MRQGRENSQVISVWVWVNVWCLTCLLSFQKTLDTCGREMMKGCGTLITAVTFKNSVRKFIHFCTFSSSTIFRQIWLKHLSVSLGKKDDQLAASVPRLFEAKFSGDKKCFHQCSWMINLSRLGGWRSDIHDKTILQNEWINHAEFRSCFSTRMKS